MPDSTQQQNGFTLIELVIAVAIIGILTIIAVPSYQQYVLRTNRAAAKAVLLDVAQREEAYFGDRKTYAGLNQLYGGTGGAAASLYIGSDGSVLQSASSSTLYSVTLVRAGSADVTTCPFQSASSSFGKYDYVVLAKPLSPGPQVNDTRCAYLCLSNNGIRGASGTDGATGCWQR